MIDRFLKNKLKNILRVNGYALKKITPAQLLQNQKTSFSQCGEDLIVDYIFRLRNIQMPGYLDIGAHHPYFLNNTAIFYNRGCRGINVEANPTLLPAFEIYRPADVNINIGISDQSGELDFYVMKDQTLSTFSKSEYEAMIASGTELLETNKVSVTTLEPLLKKYCDGTFPDFLSLDVEGLDLRILESINFQTSFPKVICVEAAEYSPIGAGKRKSELIDFLVSKGYYEYANTNLNAILVKNEFWFGQ